MPNAPNIEPIINNEFEGFPNQENTEKQPNKDAGPVTIPADNSNMKADDKK
jgi:hypothetical protein